MRLFITRTDLHFRRAGRVCRFLLFLCKYVFIAERYAAKDKFRYSSKICTLLPSQKVENSGPPKAKLRQKQCAGYFPDSCSRLHFDFSETLRAQNSYLAPELIFQLGLKLAMKLQQNSSPVSRVEILARAEIHQVIRPLAGLKFQPGLKYSDTHRNVTYCH